MRKERSQPRSAPAGKGTTSRTSEKKRSSYMEEESGSFLCNASSKSRDLQVEIRMSDRRKGATVRRPP